MTKWAVALILAAVACGCSNGKQMTVDDVKSQLTEAVSLAATAELSIDRTDAAATTPAFKSGNIEYLQQQVDDQLKEISDKRPQPNAQAAADQCHNGLARLRDALAKVEIDRDGAKSQIHSIRQSLERARASL